MACNITAKIGRFLQPSCISTINLVHQYSLDSARQNQPDIPEDVQIFFIIANHMLIERASELNDRGLTTISAFRKCP